MNQPFANPFQSAPPGPPAAQGAAAPTPSVSSQPLAAAPAGNSGYQASVHPSPVASARPVEPAPVATGSIHTTSVAEATGPAGWSAVGGSPVLVIQGDSADSLARRYGVPLQALLTANGLRSASEVRPGMHVIVPVYNARAVASEQPHKTAAAERAEESSAKSKASAKTKTETADAEERKSAKTKAKSTASEDDLPTKGKGKKSSVERADSAPAKGKKTAVETADVAPSKGKKVADAETAPTKGKADAKTQDIKTQDAKSKPDATKPSAGKGDAKAATPAETTEAPKTTEAAKTAEADAGGPEFRWPARGRIIQGFKAGGNDGINISVPEGTSVRAAESGVVAYAGSELKGYGNLVLIRHPNGFVTAYANNGEIDVKRGDQVKRGQVIAKSGESGNVNAPQLHFELRDKGGQPVDPTSYLAGI